MNLKQKFILCFLFVAVYIQAQTDSELLLKLKSFSQLEVEKINAPEGFQEAYLIMIQQPLDHLHPEAGFFKQRIWLTHNSRKAPVVMVTEGYSASKNYITELAEELKANQIIVEHRYFMESTPENKDWKYLTVRNAAADHHEIIELFNKIYKGKWLTTGISKGGQTTLFHRAFYPRDVDVSVPYVAPINLDKEDPRLLKFFDTVGTQEDRVRIKNFQEIVLKKKDAILPAFIEECKVKNWTYSMGYEKAFEMSVLEYPFAFWQWGIDVKQIPGENATDEEVLKHFLLAASPDYFSDEEMKKYESFFYQAYKELGYYNYVPGELSSMMNCIKEDTVHNWIFAPGGDTLKYTRNTMLEVVKRLKRSNPKMVLICGEYDPWGATSLDVSGMSRSLKVVKPYGSHKARINNLSEAKKEEVWELLKKWMKVDR